MRLAAQGRFRLVDPAVFQQRPRDLLVALQGRHVVRADPADQVLARERECKFRLAHQAQTLHQVAGRIDDLAARAEPQSAGQAFLEQRCRILEVVQVGLVRAEVVQRIDDEAVLAAASCQRQPLVEQVQRAVVVAAHRQHRPQCCSCQVGIDRVAPFGALVQRAQQRFCLGQPAFAAVPLRARLPKQLCRPLAGGGGIDEQFARLQMVQALAHRSFAQLVQGAHAMGERALPGTRSRTLQDLAGPTRCRRAVGDQYRQGVVAAIARRRGIDVHGCMALRRVDAGSTMVSAPRQRP
jgi:hypothetical protein